MPSSARGSCSGASRPDLTGPLEGVLEVGEWRDTIHLGGFSRDCFAWRERTSSLIVPGDALVATRVSGDALNVLNTVLTWEAPNVRALTSDGGR